MAEYYTVVNRCSKKVQTMWDGKPYELGPFESAVFPELVAYAFKRWNIQMGSLDPQTGRVEFLVGIKEKDEPCEPLKNEVIIDRTTGKPAVEVWDRSRLTGARPSEVVPGDNGLYSADVLKGRQPTDLNFDGR
jgi:hypothetical protein